MLTVVALLTVASFQTPAPIRGFPRSMVDAQVRRERTARLVPNPDTLRALLRSYSAEPHEAGTDRSRHVAEQILARWRGMGLDARIEQFDALMPRPVARTLEMTAPERYTAQLQELSRKRILKELTLTGTHPATIMFRVRIRPSDRVALVTWHHQTAFELKC